MTFRSFGPDEFLFLLTGLQWTVLLTAIALIGGGIAGFLIALARVSTIKWLRVVAG
jgi:polar amino acid transport system permease protein